jgi:DNA-binding protein HU-beta
MTKADVIKIVAQRTGSEPLIVSQVIESLVTTVKDSLAEGNPIYARGFGSFVLKKRAKKVARNITKNEALMVDEHVVPSFKPASEFVEKVKQRANQ